MGTLLDKNGIGGKSGIYLFGSPEEVIIYIGKAAKNNLHERVWDHCRTPSEGKSNVTKIFPKHGFNNPDAPAEKEYIRSGNARLGVITVSDPDLVSLIEVFLHTLHVKKHSRLPALNKQIG